MHDRVMTVRHIPVEECPWVASEHFNFPDGVPDGQILYLFDGPTYGCVDWSSSVAVSLVQGEYPFMELPRGSVVPA